MADECRFDLQLELMLLIIRVHFVVLQTRSVRDNVILITKVHFGCSLQYHYHPEQEMYLLCEEEESIIRQTQKGAACQN